MIELKITCEDAIKAHQLASLAVLQGLAISITVKTEDGESFSMEKVDGKLEIKHKVNGKFVKKEKLGRRLSNLARNKKPKEKTSKDKHIIKT